MVLGFITEKRLVPWQFTTHLICGFEIYSCYINAGHSFRSVNSFGFAKHTRVIAMCACLGSSVTIFYHKLSYSYEAILYAAILYELC